MHDGETADCQVGADARTLASGADKGAYIKQPLSGATLDALRKLVARGGVAGQAAQEMLNAELLTADADYAARIQGMTSSQAGAERWLTRAKARVGAWLARV